MLRWQLGDYGIEHWKWSELGRTAGIIFVCVSRVLKCPCFSTSGEPMCSCMNSLLFETFQKRNVAQVTNLAFFFLDTTAHSN